MVGLFYLIVMNRTRRTRNVVEDLELRLAPAYVSKGGILANDLIRGRPSEVITIDDDDDDPQVYSIGSSREVRSFVPNSNSWIPALAEEDLELRLGPRAASIKNTQRSNVRTRKHEDEILDLCECTCGKRKVGQTSGNLYVKDGGKDIKLKCAICMDIMKDETSTVCGHLFCKPCITSAVLAQRKCPTCRARLTLQNIHRIYLPGAAPS